ncbi:MAG: hypothetical protein VX738_12065 [Planctomycetota bacterium]|nr:hypothetical protein [Planctomycetota bacterium]
MTLFFPKPSRLIQLAFLIPGILMTQSVDAQLSPPTGASYGGSVPNSSKVVTGIAWYGVLEDGLAEAKRTGKPILLITAAAQCGGVPGMW